MWKNLEHVTWKQIQVEAAYLSDPRRCRRLPLFCCRWGVLSPGSRWGCLGGCWKSATDEETPKTDVLAANVPTNVPPWVRKRLLLVLGSAWGSRLGCTAWGILAAAPRPRSGPWAPTSACPPPLCGSALARSCRWCKPGCRLDEQKPRGFS